MNSKYCSRVSLTLIIMVGLTLIGCGKGGLFGTGKGTDVVRPKSWIVEPGGVTQDGCLNLGKLYASTQNFPDTTFARLFTNSIRVSNNGGMHSGYGNLIYRSTFTFEEGNFNDLFSEYGGMQQRGCSSATITDQNGTAQDFDIVEALPSKIVLSQDSTKRKITYELEGPQRLSIIKEYGVTDYCYEKQVANVIHSMTLEWGGDNVRNENAEHVDPATLRSVSHVVVTVPDEISSALNGSDSSDVMVPVSGLRALAQTEPDPNLLGGCPQGSGQAVEGRPDDATPTGSPTPTPTPAPAPASRP